MVAGKGTPPGQEIGRHGVGQGEIQSGGVHRTCAVGEDELKCAGDRHRREGREDRQEDGLSMVLTMGDAKPGPPDERQREIPLQRIAVADRHDQAVDGPGPLGKLVEET